MFYGQSTFSVEHNTEIMAILFQSEFKTTHSDCRMSLRGVYPSGIYWYPS